jgi:hypothetical protein
MQPSLYCIIFLFYLFFNNLITLLLLLLFASNKQTSKPGKINMYFSSNILIRCEKFSKKCVLFFEKSFQKTVSK